MAGIVRHPVGGGTQAARAVCAGVLLFAVGTLSGATDDTARWQALGEAIQAKVDGLAPFRISYQATWGRGPVFEPDTSEDPAQALEYLKSVTIREQESGCVVFNRSRRLVLFENESLRGGKRGKTAAWCDLQNGVTKWEMSGEAHGSTMGGTILAGMPIPLCEFGSMDPTPLIFMYWPFPGMRTLAERMREPQERGLCWGGGGASATGRSRLLRLRTWESSRLVPEPNNVDPIAWEGNVVRQAVWLCPKRGLLPVRRDVVDFDSDIDDVRPLCVELDPGEYTTAQLVEFLKGSQLDPAEYVISGNRVTLTLDADFRRCRTREWYWVLSSAEAADGTHYPTDMVIIARRGATPASPGAHAWSNALR